MWCLKKRDIWREKAMYRVRVTYRSPSAGSSASFRRKPPIKACPSPSTSIRRTPERAIPSSSVSSSNRLL